MILFYIGRIIVEWSCQIKKADDLVDGFVRLFGNCVKVIFVRIFHGSMFSCSMFSMFSSPYFMAPCFLLHISWLHVFLLHVG